MNRLASLLILAAVSVLSLAWDGPVHGQAMPAAASINFENKTPKPLIIHGLSFVGGVPRKGQPLLIAPGKSAWDNNVPPGIRIYKIYDATQPSRMLLPKDFQINVQKGDQFLVVLPNKDGTVIILPGGP